MKMMRKPFLRDGLGIKGTAALELALLAPLLASLATGGWDFGNALLQQERLASAARAGAQYAVASMTNSTNYAGMIQAARNDAGDTANALQVTAQKVCTCPAGGAVSCSGGTCAGNAAPYSYAQVIVSEPYTLMVSYPGIGSSLQLSGKALLRLN
jgi:Flp pilus assembly protein TadG